MSTFTDLLNNFPPIVRLGILLMVTGAAYMLVLSLQQQSGELVGRAKRNL